MKEGKLINKAPSPISSPRDPAGWLDEGWKIESVSPLNSLFCFLVQLLSARRRIRFMQMSVNETCCPTFSGAHKICPSQWMSRRQRFTRLRRHRHQRAAIKFLRIHSPIGAVKSNAAPIVAPTDNGMRWGWKRKSWKSRTHQKKLA